MKKLKHKGKCLLIFSVLFLGITFVILFFIIFYYAPGKQWKGTFFRYDEMLMSSNENYIGIIETESEKVSIVDYSGKEMSSVDLKGKHPSQIVLGKSSFFLLYRWEDENGAGKIVQYDFQSNKIKEYVVSNIATIAYKNDFLFIGDWKHEDEDCSLIPYCNGFYANRYIEEEEFGKQLKELSLIQRWGCNIGDIKMYYHEEGYFSTEPVWNDYPGTSTGNFTMEDEVWNFQANTKQEKQNRTLLVKMIGKIEDVQEPVYQVYEYQSGNDIYGVCNVFKEYIPVHPIESKDVIKSYCYKINRESNKVKIMAQTNFCIAIIATNDVYIYQKENLIIRHNIKTGEEKIIHKFKNYFSANVYVQGDYLVVRDQDKYIFVKWNSVY